MALNLSHSQRVKEEVLTGVDMRTVFDAGSLILYNGTQPINADASEGGASALMTIALPADAYGEFNIDRIDIASIWAGTVALTGVATWFRLYAHDQAGNPLFGEDVARVSARIDGTVGTTPGAFNLIVADTNLTQGQIYSVSSFPLIVRSPVLN